MIATAVDRFRVTAAVLAEASTSRETTIVGRSQRGLLTDAPPIRARLPLVKGDLVVDSPRPEPKWLYPTLHAFKCVAALQEGWDSYGGAPPSDAAIFAAMEVLGHLLGQESDPPQVVPSSTGSVQLEWHRGGVDVEITADPTGRLSAYYRLTATGVDREIEPLEGKDLPGLMTVLGNY